MDRQKSWKVQQIFTLSSMPLLSRHVYHVTQYSLLHLGYIHMLLASCRDLYSECRGLDLLKDGQPEEGRDCRSRSIVAKGPGALCV